jgi:hypothetical protein
VPELCRHGRKLCSECVIVTDAARRACDIIRAYVTFVDYDTRIRSWVALRLADGGSDGTLYDSKREAVRHQADERLCAYFSFRNAPSGFASLIDAQLYMDYHRAAYDAGFRLPDPDDLHGGPDLIMPTTQEDLLWQRARLIRGRG